MAKIKKRSKIPLSEQNIFRRDILREQTETQMMKNSIWRAFPNKEDRNNYINSLIEIMN